jgi:hypothetical protein
MTYRITQLAKEVNAVPIQAVLQGAGLLSGLVTFHLNSSGKCVNCMIKLNSLKKPPAQCRSDQFFFNLTSFDAEKKQILLSDVKLEAKDGSVHPGNWTLCADVETAYGRFDYGLHCLESGGRSLRPGDTLRFRLCCADEQSVFHADSFIDAPASTINGFQAALLILFPGGIQKLAGGQFEYIADH